MHDAQRAVRATSPGDATREQPMSVASDIGTIRKGDRVA